MDYAKESLRLHGEWKGKIEVVTRVPVENKDDLSLAYTPGVAQPCLEIQKDVDVYKRQGFVIMGMKYFLLDADSLEF